MSACIVTISDPQVFSYVGQHWSARGFLTLSAAYTAGGDTLTPAQIGFGAGIRLFVLQYVSGVETASAATGGTAGVVLSAIAPVPGGGTENWLIQGWLTGASASAVLTEVSGDQHLIGGWFYALGV